MVRGRLQKHRAHQALPVDSCNMIRYNSSVVVTAACLKGIQLEEHLHVRYCEHAHMEEGAQKSVLLGSITECYAPSLGCLALSVGSVTGISRAHDSKIIPRDQSAINFILLSN